MNISGIIVQTTPQYLSELVEILKHTEFCDYHLHDDIGHIIVTVEGKDTGEEIEKLMKIKALEHVISAEMQFSYNEEEIELLQRNLETAKSPEWLNDEMISAEQIEYHGDLKDKKRRN